MSMYRVTQFLGPVPHTLTPYIILPGNICSLRNWALKLQHINKVKINVQSSFNVRSSNAILLICLSNFLNALFGFNCGISSRPECRCGWTKRHWTALRGTGAEPPAREILCPSVAWQLAQSHHAPQSALLLCRVSSYFGFVNLLG